MEVVKKREEAQTGVLSPDQAEEESRWTSKADNKAERDAIGPGQKQNTTSAAVSMLACF